jgi:tRNA (cmo5U34)-methyltransferase
MAQLRNRVLAIGPLGQPPGCGRADGIPVDGSLTTMAWSGWSSVAGIEAGNEAGNEVCVEAGLEAEVESDVPAMVETGYEQIVTRLIPGYASLARLGVALLAASPLASAQGASVLVAGCGSGAELLEARDQRPDWQLTALDPSAAMLALARGRLAGQAGIDWQQASVESLEARARFDGALAVLVLQALPDDGSKLAFLTALARSLRPGGQVVLVDLMQPERSPIQQQLREARLGFQRASGLATDATTVVDREALSIPGADPAARVALIADLTTGLHPIGLSRLTALVEAAGFGDPAPVYQALDVEGFLLQRRD